MNRSEAFSAIAVGASLFVMTAIYGAFMLSNPEVDARMTIIAVGGLLVLSPFVCVMMWLSSRPGWTRSVQKSSGEPLE